VAIVNAVASDKSFRASNCALAGTAAAVANAIAATPSTAFDRMLDTGIPPLRLFSGSQPGAAAPYQPAGSAESRARGSQGQHDLAEMLVRARMRGGLADGFERERPVDRQPQCAGDHRVPQVGPHATPDYADLLDRTRPER